MIERIQDYMRQNYQCHERIVVPPLDIFLHPTDSQIEASVAIPNGSINRYDSLPLGALRVAFGARRLPARVSFLEGYARALGPMLLGAGFVEIQRTPVLLCTPNQLRTPTPAPGLTINMLTRESPLELLREGLDVNSRGFALDAPATTEAEAELFRQSLITGRAFIVYLNGQPAGAGMFTEIERGLTQLVGITTLAPFRRRGIAASLTAHMAAAAFANGAEAVFLVAVDQAAARVYTRVGFVWATDQLIFQDGVTLS